MSLTPAFPDGQLPSPPRTSRIRQLSKVVMREPVGALGAGMVMGLLLIAFFAPLLAPHDPISGAARRLLPPGAVYPFGTDEFGRDLLSRVIYGARISLYVGSLSVAIALVFGSSIGLVAGYFGGYTDAGLMRAMDILFAFPPIILAVAVAGVLGPSLTNVMIAIGIVYTPTFARVVRGPTLAVREMDYVLAAYAIGSPELYILRRHVLPNVAAPVIVQATLSFSTAILAEATLSFLGFGAQPPAPSWGTMVSTGMHFMELAPWTVIFPGLAIALAVLAFNLFGDGLRDSLDPRLRHR
jgi:peptide/nickel transport system permease protein